MLIWGTICRVTVNAGRRIRSPRVIVGLCQLGPNLFKCLYRYLDYDDSVLCLS